MADHGIVPIPKGIEAKDRQPDRLERSIDRTTKMVGSRRVSDIALTPADYGAARDLTDRGWFLWRLAIKGHVDEFLAVLSAMELCALEDAELVEGQLVHQHSGCPGHNESGTRETTKAGTAGTAEGNDG